MDEVKRKLAIIDKRLACGAGYFHKRIISTCPLAFAAIGLIAGIVIQEVIFELQVTTSGSQLLWLWLILLVIFTALTYLFFILRKWEATPYSIAYIALFCFICLEEKACNM